MNSKKLKNSQNKNKRQQIDKIIMFLSLKNKIAQLETNEHQMTIYNPMVVLVTITK